MPEKEGTAIWVSASVKDRLDALKVGDQSYSSVIERMLDGNGNPKGGPRQ